MRNILWPSPSSSNKVYSAKGVDRLTALIFDHPSAILWSWSPELWKASRYCFLTLGVKYSAALCASFARTSSRKRIHVFWICVSIWPCSSVCCALATEKLNGASRNAVNISLLDALAIISAPLLSPFLFQDRMRSTPRSTRAPPNHEPNGMSRYSRNLTSIELSNGQFL